jgi:glucose/arabinose dehydrogenase/PKD repeat protein
VLSPAAIAHGGNNCMSHVLERRRHTLASTRRSLLKGVCSTVVVLVVATLAVVIGAGTAAAEEVPAGFTVVAEPTGSGTIVEIAHAPDGRRFLAEKGGRVKVLHQDGRVTQLIDLRNRVNDYSDRGLLGIAVDDGFASNGWLYLLFSQELNPAEPDGPGPMTSALTRVTVRPDSTVADATSPGVFILGAEGQQPCPTPTNDLDCMPSDHFWHTIGTVRVDPADGTLWVGSGDAHVTAIDGTSYRPFDPTNTAGKILHIDKSGRGLADHPFCPGVTDLTQTCTKVYAMGFRNPFRFTLRPGTGPVVGDVGQEAYEEIDLIRPGGNYGWPCYEGPTRYRLHQSSPVCQDLYAKEGTAGGAIGPSWSYPHGGGGSVVAGPVYTGDSYPADMRGDIFVADYVNGWVKRLDVDAQDRVTGVHDFATGWTGVSLFEAPDGNIGYLDMGWASGAAGVRTYTYSGPANTPPTAAATATPTSGSAPLTVTFSGAGSSDPEGGQLGYEWDFGDNSGRATTADVQHVYNEVGSYTATLTVRDPQGATGTATVQVTVGDNSAPTVTIDGPTADFLYSNGTPVELSGSATDGEDGALDGTRLSWQVMLQHNTHFHQIATSTGATSRFTPVTDHDADSSYEIRLTATDSLGASATAVRAIRPRTVQLTLASSVPGIPLSYEGQSGAAPWTRTAAVGFRTTVEAPASHVVDGITYEFRSWSDGGAARHTIDVPSSSTTLTAHYEPAGPPAPETLTFVPVADTYVAEQSPTTDYGSRSSLWADGKPSSWSLARFDVTGLGDRAVTKVVLRMHETDDSDSGGRVRGVVGPWSESTTWNTRPQLGDVHAELAQPVSNGNWYEIELPVSVVTGEGALDLGLDTLSSNGHVWASRHTTTPPQLLVTVEDSGAEEPPPPPPSETLTFVPTADTYVSSQNPTTGYGSRSSLWADANPENWSLARFAVSGLDGRSVSKVVLRVHETDASDSGGRVRQVLGSWSESTTWNTRPSLTNVHAEFDQPVSAGTWYEIELPASVVTGEGEVDLGFDTLSTNGHVWASRHTATPPQLIVTVDNDGGEEPPPPPPATETLTFQPTEDTYVSSQNPTTDYGARSSLWADANPENWSLARFVVVGLDGRSVSKVVLRVHETDASDSGGRVRQVVGPWSESTTWNSRPQLSTVYAEVGGPVAAGTWYDIELPTSMITGEGEVDLGFDTLSTNGHVWASRHTTTPPQLIVTMDNDGGEEPPPPPPATQTLMFEPSADTYVSAQNPTTDYGTRSSLWADASPQNWSLARFDVAGLLGRTPTKVVLRVHETDGSDSGGRVRAVLGGWTESTTWEVRPMLGEVYAALDQPVSAGTWYEIELPASAVTGDGPIDLGFDTLSTNGHVWASRHTATPAQLLVTFTP